MTEDQNILALKDDLSRRAPKIATGTVVKFLAHEKFNYAAIYVAATRSWYITGRGYESQVSHEDFLDTILTSEEVSDVKVASGWTDLT